jgi:excisionase family DNA binding protein
LERATTSDPTVATDVLLTPDDLAAKFNVRKTWIYIKVESGELPHVRLGRYLRFRLVDVEAYLRAQRRGV